MKILKPSSRILVLAAGLLFLSACNFSLAEDITPPPGANIPTSNATQSVLTGPLYPLVPPNPVNGAPIFADKCLPCHGQTGMGDGPQASQLPSPPQPLGSADYARQSKPADWYVEVTRGNIEKFMPPFTSLSDRQRWDVVAYLYTLSMPPDTISQGKQLYQAKCAECHGDQGKGDGAKSASLPVPPGDLTNQETMAQKSSADFFQSITDGIAAPDGSQTMPAFKDQLSDSERWALADYVRTLTFAPSAQAEGAQGTPTALAQVNPSPAPSAEGTPSATQTEAPLGTVKGKVVNSSGGEVPADLEVVLHAFDNMQEAFTQTEKIAADDTFTFENIQMPADRSFIASTEYGKVLYGSDVVPVTAGQDTIDLSLPIYDSTTDTSGLSVDRLHIFFQMGGEQTIQVIELYIISNLSNRTVVASAAGQSVLTFDLPQGATNLQFEGGSLGDRFVQTPNGFGDTDVIRPSSGQHQVIFAFDMPYDRKLVLKQPLNLPVNAVVILIPENGLKVKSDLLTDKGNTDVQGTSYHMYSSAPLPAGTSFDMTVTGSLSSSPSLTTGSKNGLVIGLGAFGLALLVAGLWIFRHNQVRSIRAKEDFEEEILTPPDQDDSETLMDAIIALDEQYQSGELPEEAYRTRRAELKTRLQEVMKDQG